MRESLSYLLCLCVLPRKQDAIPQPIPAAQSIGAGSSLGMSRWTIPSAVKYVRDDLDLNAGTVLEGRETVAEAGRRVFRAIVAIASGTRPSLAEEWRHVEFQIWAESGPAL